MKTAVDQLAAFGWKTGPGFSPEQLDLLLRSAQVLQSHADAILPGRGAAWLRRWLSPVRFHRGGLPQWVVTQAAGYPLSVVFPRRDIWLTPDFAAQPDPVQHLLHELAHIVDNLQTSRIIPATLRGGGPADQLIRALGGLPRGMRFSNGRCGLPQVHHWPGGVNDGYGNSASAEYFAEAFAWSVLNPSLLPSPLVADWLRVNVFLAAPMEAS